MLLSLICLIFQQAAEAQALIRPNLANAMHGFKADTMVRINIVMQEQYPVYDLQNKFSKFEGNARRNAVIEELKKFSAESSKDLVGYLLEKSEKNKAAEIRTLWIANIINCYVKPEILEAIAQRTDVRSIDLDLEKPVIEPQPSVAPDQISAPAEIAWNVSRVNAPQVWDQGFTGQNILVSVIDSGVNYNHDDLENMWEHPNFPFHGWNFVHGNNDPMDDHGHGTHVAGTVAGSGASGSQTGIAPGASIMAIKALTETGFGTEFNVWSAIEFSVDHDAHIINLSLGWTLIHNPDRASWRNVMDNTLAAGVIAAVAAGNEGNNLFTFPIPNNVRTPGDCPPPWLHPNQTLTGGISSVVTIGATDINDNVAGFSSLGPVTWGSIPGYNDYPFNPGIGLIRPDVVAPGVNIRSLAHYNNTDYVDGWQGTSMAAPCVAGTMALLLSKNPSLTPAQISQVLEETAVSDFPFKNNQYGSGLIDAYAAFNAIPFPGPSYHSHAYYDTTGLMLDSIFPGVSVILTLSLKNTDSIPVNNVNVLFSCTSPYINVTDSLEFFGSFEPGEIIIKENAFSFEVSDTIPGGMMVRFGILSFNDENSWMSTFTDIAYGPNLVAGEMFVIDSLGNNNGRLDPGETATINVLNTNTGQWASEAAMAILNCDNPWVTINVETSPLGVIEPGDTLYADFQVTVDPETPVGTVLEFEYTISSWPYQVNELYYQTVGLVIEDFESGGFSAFNWKHAGHRPWIVANSNAFEGSYSAHSGQITHNEHSQLFIELTVAGYDSISFYRKVSSEEYFDFLNFFINDYVVGAWSGEKDWERVVFHVPPGPVVFKWEYRKDQSISAGEDKAWIDYIVFPGMLKVNAGDDAEVCPGDNHQLQGDAMNQSSVLWNTTGTGYFNDSTILDPVYYPGEEDIIAGSVHLKLTAFGLNTHAIDEVELIILPEAEAFAGPDTTSCQGLPVILSQSSALNSDSVSWTSAGSGVFDDPGQLHPTYYPSQEDVLADSVRLSMIAYGINLCTTDTSFLTLRFINEPYVFAGPDSVLCMIYDYQAVHAVAENHAGLFWTTSGNGTFNDQTLLHPVYTPSAADHDRGFVHLTMYAAGIDACENASSSLTLVFIPRAVAWAGHDLTVCIGDTVHITADSTAFSNRLEWTSTGTGSFSNDSILHPVYYPGAEDYEEGVIQIILRAYGHASCPPDIHSIFVNFIGAPAPPLMPLGPDSVDVYTDSVSYYTTMGVYLAQDFQWQLLPSEAGTITQNFLEAWVDWNPDFNGLAEISVLAMNDCGIGDFSPAKFVQVYSSTGIQEVERYGVHVFPVPAGNRLEIILQDMTDSKIIISILDMQGRTIRQEVADSDNQGRISLDVSRLRPGVYYVRVSNQKYLHYTRIIVAR